MQSGGNLVFTSPNNGHLVLVIISTEEIKVKEKIIYDSFNFPPYRKQERVSISRNEKKLEKSGANRMLLTAVLLFILFALSLLIKTPNQETDSLYWPIASFFIGVGVYSVIPYLWIFSNSSMRSRGREGRLQTVLKVFLCFRSKLVRITNIKLNLRLRATNQVGALPT